jgi:hypothetical protein
MEQGSHWLKSQKASSCIISKDNRQESVESDESLNLCSDESWTAASSSKSSPRDRAAMTIDLNKTSTNQHNPRPDQMS